MEEIYPPLSFFVNHHAEDSEQALVSGHGLAVPLGSMDSILRDQYRAPQLAGELSVDKRVSLSDMILLGMLNQRMMLSRMMLAMTAPVARQRVIASIHLV